MSGTATGHNAAAELALTVRNHGAGIRIRVAEDGAMDVDAL